MDLKLIISVLEMKLGDILTFGMKYNTYIFIYILLRVSV